MQELWHVVLLVAYPEGARLQPQDFAKDVSKEMHFLELSRLSMAPSRPEVASSQGALSGGRLDKAGAEQGAAAGMAWPAGQSEHMQPIHVLRLVKHAHAGHAGQRYGENELPAGSGTSRLICAACVRPGGDRGWDELCIVECQDTADALAKTRTQARLPMEDEMVLLTGPAHKPTARM